MTGRIREGSDARAIGNAHETRWRVSASGGDETNVSQGSKEGVAKLVKLTVLDDISRT